MTEELRKIAEQHVPIRGKHKSKERNRLESALQEATELIVRRCAEVVCPSCARRYAGGSIPDKDGYHRFCEFGSGVVRKRKCQAAAILREFGVDV